jgi:hypothetical protein
MFVIHATRPNYRGRITSLLPEDQLQLAHYVTKLICSSLGAP